VNRSSTTAPLARLAQTALLVAGVVCVLAAIAAVRLTPTPTVEAGARGSDRSTTVAAVPSVSDTGIARAVEHDMFAESREAPARAYTLADAASVEPLEVDGDAVNVEAPIGTRHRGERDRRRIRHVRRPGWPCGRRATR
jgi:hypothetical protein